MTELLPVVMTVFLAKHRSYFPKVDIRTVRGSVDGAKLLLNPAKTHVMDL